MSNENTYSNLPPDEREKEVQKELMPFAIYAILPILLTIIIAFVFGTTKG